MIVVPDIPSGTVVHLQREGYGDLKLAASQDADNDAGIDLGEQATATIIQFDPATDDRDLYVRITNGEYAGKTGWTYSLHASGEDGSPIALFSEAVLEPPRPTGSDPKAHVYAIRSKLRVFTRKEVCEAGYNAMHDDAAKRVLRLAFENKEFYDFPPQEKLHVIEDNDPNSLFIIVGDSNGHQGCASRYMLPGYVQ
jgi:hypothetical protein